MKDFFKIVSEIIKKIYVYVIVSVFFVIISIVLNYFLNDLSYYILSISLGIVASIIATGITNLFSTSKKSRAIIIVEVHQFVNYIREYLELSNREQQIVYHNLLNKYESICSLSIDLIDKSKFDRISIKMSTILENLKKNDYKSLEYNIKDLEKYLSDF